MTIVHLVYLTCIGVCMHAWETTCVGCCDSSMHECIQRGNLPCTDHRGLLHVSTWPAGGSICVSQHPHFLDLDQQEELPSVQACAFGDGDRCDITKAISTVNLHVIRCTYEVRPRPSIELYVLGADAKIRKFGSPVDASLV